MNAHQLLLDELARRQSKNPRYSMRSFARFLGVSPTALSNVLAGKRRLSRRSLVKCCEQLGLSPETTAAVLHGEGYRVEPGSEPCLAMAEHQFAMISEWYYFAVLSLAKMEVEADVRSIARRLGISASQARSAVEGLEREGLIGQHDGHLVRYAKPVSLPPDIPSAARRKHHTQILERAALSLEAHDVSRRDFSSMTLAIDPTRLTKAKKMIAAFMDRLAAHLEGGSRTEVFGFGVQLFPLGLEASSHE